MRLNQSQTELINSPIHRKTFVQGLAGTGKTTAAIGRLAFLLDHKVSPERILLFTPQRSYQEPYIQFLTQQKSLNGSIQMATLGGLARRNIDLFWPMIAEQANFSNPNLPPTFLTLETAQYHMMSVIQPFLAEGKFSSVIVDKNRLSSQILDNLNKSAMISIDYHTIGERLSSAWSGDKNYLKIYQETQDCINLFRNKCLQNNLLDHSLQIELFQRYLWNTDLINQELRNSVDHIFYDNCEEDFPVAHEIIQNWSTSCESILILFDSEAGYRKFLGADPISALKLAHQCDEIVQFSEPIEKTEKFRGFINGLHQTLIEKQNPMLPSNEKTKNRESIRFLSAKYFPELIDEVVAQVDQLVNENKIPAKEIAIIAPFINDSLWFPLQKRLETKGITSIVQRPSRSFIDEPIINCLITLAKIAHPSWNLIPTHTEFTHSMFQIINGIDLARTKLLCDIVYRGNLKLTSFNQIKPDMQKRIKLEFGEKYETLRIWMEQYKASDLIPLDHFFRRIFGEVLSQSGFQLQQRPDSLRLISQLIQSIYKFRQSIDPRFDNSNRDQVAIEYINLLSDGILAANYNESAAADESRSNSVLITPALTYLLTGHPCRVQFWMDAGSMGWFERIDQPLTHPYVLSKNWVVGQKWTDKEEYESNSKTMYAMISGLIRKCSGQIYVGFSQFTESGYEQKGPLIQVLQKLL